MGETRKYDILKTMLRIAGKKCNSTFYGFDQQKFLVIIEKTSYQSSSELLEAVAATRSLVYVLTSLAFVSLFVFDNLCIIGVIRFVVGRRGEGKKVDG